MESEELKNIRMNIWQLVNELKEINKTQKHMNWNLGRICAALEGNTKLTEKIKEAQSKQ